VLPFFAPPPYAIRAAWLRTPPTYGIYTVADPFANTGYPLVLGSAVTTLEGIDMRNRQNLRYYASGYPFEYYMARFLYPWEARNRNGQIQT